MRWQDILAKDCPQADYDSFMSNIEGKMKPSEQCKAAGLKNLDQLSEVTGVSIQTLINWHKFKPLVFKYVLMGVAAELKG